MPLASTLRSVHLAASGPAVIPSLPALAEHDSPPQPGCLGGRGCAPRAGLSLCKNRPHSPRGCAPCLTTARDPHPATQGRGGVVLSCSSVTCTALLGRDGCWRGSIAGGPEPAFRRPEPESNPRRPSPQTRLRVWQLLGLRLAHQPLTCRATLQSLTCFSVLPGGSSCRTSPSFT